MSHPLYLRWRSYEAAPKENIDISPSAIVLSTKQKTEAVDIVYLQLHIAVLFMLPPPAVAAATATSILNNAVPTILTSAAAFAMATIAPTVPTATETLSSAIATATGSPHDPPPNGECRLLGPFALIVQAALGGLALLALVFKRYRERPQRPLKIWAFDVSKQVVGSVLVHIANLVMSMLSSGQLSIKVGPEHIQGADEPYTPNPCSFYLLNLAIDVSRSILIHTKIVTCTNATIRPPSVFQYLSSFSASSLPYSA